jgi:hypothetical protein
MKSLRKAHEPELREWRRARLIQAGFEPELATRLGWDERIDVHDLLELVDRGCPPALAARIVAPL